MCEIILPVNQVLITMLLLRPAGDKQAKEVQLL